MDVTTVADDLVVLHDGTTVHRFEGLEPDTEYRFEGVTVRTLPRPGGELMCRFATVNDVHFGEAECGKLDDSPQGPIRRAAPGDPPYPEVMNAGAADEILAAGITTVVVKGDLTAYGQPEEFAAFEACWRPRFGDGLHVVRGNHDAYLGQDHYAGDRYIDLPGLTVALVDTVIPTKTTGRFTDLQAERLGEAAHEARQWSRAVIVMGHHQNWIGGELHGLPGAHRSDGYFGIHPDDSDRLAHVIRRSPAIVAYAAGHTHRHRVRPMHGHIPSIEIGCVKDFPGTWAEYRVYEGGVMQVVHRVSTPAALAWSESCRHLYADFGLDYEAYALGALAQRCFVIPPR